MSAANDCPHFFSVMHLVANRASQSRNQRYAAHMPAKKRAAPKAFDVSSITIDDLIRIFERHSYRRPKKSASDLPEAPYQVKDVPPTSPNEISYFRSYFKNPDRVEGVLRLKRPTSSAEIKGRRSQETKKPSGIK